MAWEEIEGQLKGSVLDPVRGTWSKAMRGPKDVQEIGYKAFRRFHADNGFFSLYLPFIGDIESELMSMCTSLFNPQGDSTASMTSGGSESIFAAMHAAREWSYRNRPKMNPPEVIIPYSAHAAFDKACHYFNLKLVRTPIGDDYRADLEAMEQGINENTICLVGSAPCWSFGRYDPISEIGALAEKYNLWMHVDACVGGYLAPFVEKLGVELPPWDFRVPGVKSISADLHKYGYCPKPCSTIIWRSEGYLDYHYVHPENWPAGPYRMVGMAGSRSAGPIFAAWSVLKYLGEEGYVRLARQLMETKEKLTTGARAIDGLTTLDIDLMPMAIASTSVDLKKVMAGMTEKGWILLGNYEPPLINIPVDGATDDTVVDTFLTELKEVVKRAQSGDLKEESELRYG
jgi:glutamate/tyrosine decarboxylase-like PLP-dependent enzyme